MTQDSEQSSSEPDPSAAVLSETERLLTAAAGAGVELRLTGSVAIWRRSPGAASFLRRTGRELKDIDVAVTKKSVKAIRRLVPELGYTTDQAALVAFEGRRLLFESEQHGFPIDVFVDELNFCHRIDLRDRLLLSGESLPPADLLLAKLQIVDISPADFIDMMALFMEHTLGSTDDEEINVDYIAHLLAGDWGFHYTVTTNLQKLRTAVDESVHLQPDELRRVLDRLAGLLERIEAEPKSTKWKMRARIGTRMAWYTDVEEKQQAF